MTPFSFETDKDERVAAFNEHLDKLRNDVFDYVESQCSGRALTFVTDSRDGNDFRSLRQQMIEHFIKTDPMQIRMIENFLDNGMMKTNISAGFPENMDYGQETQRHGGASKGLEEHLP